MKPKVFIGSSKEGLKLAHAIHENLTSDAECTVWDSGFQLSTVTLHALLSNLRESDFGIFVFSPDDIVKMRGSEKVAARDNVVFELGLFVGRLGVERCFFLLPDNITDFHLPTDLAGIVSGRYEGHRRDNNLTAATSPACSKIRIKIQELRSFQDAVMEPKVAHAGTVTSVSNQKPSKENINAKYYKRSILIKSICEIDQNPLTDIGASWNQKLLGWVLGRSKEKKLLEIVPGLEILPEE